MKTLIQQFVRGFGYELKRVNPIKENAGHQLYQYRRIDDSFDYGSYVKAQTEGNKKKIQNVWVYEENIEYISRYIRKKVNPVRFGLCHGTRRGKEQEWFKKYLGCDVIGTEISDTAEQFPDTIQWDFHETKPEWIGAVDFIYSNSLDHSYDPKKCLAAWMSCLGPTGICIIEHSSQDEVSTSLDPFGAHVSVVPYLVLDWSEGAYSVREILDVPVKPSWLRYNKFLILQNQDLVPRKRPPAD